MPNSAVVLRLHRILINAELTLPISELALGWDKPLPMDSVLTVRQFGKSLEEYVRAHVRPTAPDGRPWTVTVLEVIPLAEQDPDVRVELTMTPPPGAPVDRLIFRYDVIFHHLITHTAVVTVASDWQNGVTGEEPVLLGTMRDTNPVIAIDRSGGAGFRDSPRCFASVRATSPWGPTTFCSCSRFCCRRRWSRRAGDGAAMRERKRPCDGSSRS